MIVPEPSQPRETEEFLVAQGIPPTLFQEAILDGYQARAACTSLHPPGYSGYVTWGEIVEGVRLRLVGLGWTPSNDGLSTIVSPDRKLAIAVSSADAGAGTTGPVRTKNPKGTATEKAVDINEQGNLFKDPLPIVLRAPRPVPTNGMQTWFLLFHVGEAHIGYELSRPFSMGEDDRPNAFHPRMRFAPIPRADTGNAPSDDGGTPPPTDHVVDVTRRR